MRVYLAIKYHRDVRNRGKIEAITQALEQAGHECVCVVRDVEEWGKVRLGAEELMDRSFELLAGSDAILIELTEKGVGLGIEAGFAWAKKVGIYTIAEEGADISETLRGISKKVVDYGGMHELPNLIEELFE